MENQKINILVHEKVQELVIREGEALEVFNPKSVIISGTIDAPLRFLLSRIEQVKLIVKSCHVLADFERGSIILEIDESSPFITRVTGELTENKDITEFNINNGKYYVPEDLSEFLKKRKHLFQSSESYISVFTALRTFEAKVNQELKSVKDDTGNYEQKKKQIVEHNVPRSFKIELPIFKGMPNVLIEVECSLNKNLEVTLYSAELIQMSSQLKTDYINDVLNGIKELAPEIAIIHI